MSLSLATSLSVLSRLLDYIKDTIHYKNHMAVALGGNQILVVVEDGFCRSCGVNDEGQLGSGDNSDRQTLEMVNALPELAKQVDAGVGYSAVVTDEGNLFMFGSGMNGKLGLGDHDNRLTPTQVPRAMFDNNDVLMVSCGSSHTVVLTFDGVYTFGGNDCGQLGHGNKQNSIEPVKVAELDGTEISMVAAGSMHTIALSKRGEVFAWGWNLAGQLGHGDKQDKLIPQKIQTEHFNNTRVRMVSAAGMHTAAVTETGRLYTWGQNHVGQLGHGDLEKRLSPTENSSDYAIASIKCTDLGTILVTKDGTLYICGLYQIKRESSFQRIDPEKFGGATVAAAAGNGLEFAAVTQDGKLWTWGSGNFGMLCHDNKEDCPDPLAVAGTGVGGSIGGVGRRWFQKFPDHAIAAAMATHARLGRTSTLAEVFAEESLLQKILGREVLFP